MESDKAAPRVRGRRRPVTEVTSSYVRVDREGVLRVAGTRVSLDSVVVAFQEGLSPEGIRQQYPALTLEAVYGAVTYYLAHRKDVEDYLRRQEQVWERARREVDSRPSPVLERLRASLRVETAAAK